MLVIYKGCLCAVGTGRRYVAKERKRLEGHDGDNSIAVEEDEFFDTL